MGRWMVGKVTRATYTPNGVSRATFKATGGAFSFNVQVQLLGGAHEVGTRVVYRMSPAREKQPSSFFFSFVSEIRERNRKRKKKTTLRGCLIIYCVSVSLSTSGTFFIFIM